MIAIWLGLTPAMAAQVCHIHPPGTELKEPEIKDAQFYNSLEDCESANSKVFGGSGRCHCFPDGFGRSREFDFRRRPVDPFGSPEKLPPP